MSGDLSLQRAEQIKRDLVKLIRDESIRDDREFKPDELRLSSIADLLILGWEYYTPDYEGELRARLDTLPVQFLNVPLLSQQEFFRFDISKGHDSYSGEGPMDARLLPVVPSETKLYHLTGYQSKAGLVDYLIRGNNVLGNPDRVTPTCLKNKKMDVTRGPFWPDDGACAFDVPIVFEIDVEILSKSRTIFYDPNCIMEGEYRNSYLVFGGIPKQAISGFKILNEQGKGIFNEK